MRINWHKYTAPNATQRNAGLTIDELCKRIEELPIGTLWRHNVAGDLPGIGEDIDQAQLQQLATANRRRSLRGFTYTHKPLTARNLRAIRAAVKNGLTINLSADNGTDADKKSRHGLPVTVILPTDAPKVSATPAGRKIVQCPAETSDRITCQNCGLCAKADRGYLIGFAPKGAKKKTVGKLAAG
jgi:hypothetical protein